MITASRATDMTKMQRVRALGSLKLKTCPRVILCRCMVYYSDPSTKFLNIIISLPAAFVNIAKRDIGLLFMQKSQGFRC